MKNHLIFIIGAVMFAAGLVLITKFTDNFALFVIGMALAGGSYGLVWRD